jgi:hypothetical protein
MVGQKRFYALSISRINDSSVSQVAFLFQRLLGQDVAFESVFPFDFSCSGKGEPLFGTGISLQFRHFSKKFIN